MKDRSVCTKARASCVRFKYHFSEKKPSMQVKLWWAPVLPTDKPPYDYATLIAYAILTSKNRCSTLNDIHRSISNKYPYFDLKVKNWKKSVRQTISRSTKWFIRVDSSAYGGFWRIEPEKESFFVELLTNSEAKKSTLQEKNIVKALPAKIKSHKNTFCGLGLAKDLPSSSYIEKPINQRWLENAVHDSTFWSNPTYNQFDVNLYRQELLDICNNTKCLAHTDFRLLA
ncbi:hypothetical protein BY458DRAFT_490355 [Sporodiniella umbellata]|nr:hypothetical protein BY458DRAFT_490355 [Sporodiniella umbellata]